MNALLIALGLWLDSPSAPTLVLTVQQRLTRTCAVLVELNSRDAVTVSDATCKIGETLLPREFQVQTLALLADHPSPLVRKCAIVGLAVEHPGRPETAFLLSAALTDQHPQVRMAAAWSFSQTPLDAGQVWPMLLKMALHDSSASARNRAADALLRVGEAALPQLGNALTNSPSPEVRRNAVSAILGFRKQASAVIPSLLVGAKDTDESVREDALSALLDSGVRSPSVVIAFQSACGDSNHNIREKAFRTLVDFRTADQRTLQCFRYGICDEQACIRQLALEGYRGQVTPSDLDRAILLMMSLFDPSPRLREQANEILEARWPRKS